MTRLSKEMKFLFLLRQGEFYDRLTYLGAEGNLIVEKEDAKAACISQNAWDFLRQHCSLEEAG